MIHGSNMVDAQVDQTQGTGLPRGSPSPPEKCGVVPTEQTRPGSGEGIREESSTGKGQEAGAEETSLGQQSNRGSCPCQQRIKVSLIPFVHFS